MKKTLCLIFTTLMIFTTLSMPCGAVQMDFSINASTNAEQNIVYINGHLYTPYSARWVTYYLLYPGKSIDDIPYHSADNPTVVMYEQLKCDKDGAFSTSFKVTEEGKYNLYVTSGELVKFLEIDTEKETNGSMLWQLHQLDESFNTRTSTDIKELFNISRSELPDEIPVVEPFPIEGLYSVFVDPVNGDDHTATGSIDKPFRTCNKALEVFNPESGMMLTLREGIYPQSDSIRLKNIHADDDLPFIITNYKNEKPTFTGGNVLKGEDFKPVADSEILQRLNPDISANIRVLDMNQYGITDFGEISTNYTPALWVDGGEYTIARWPNSVNTGMRECKDPDLIDTVGGTAEKSNGVIDCGTVTAATGSSCGEYRKYSKRATALNEAAGEIVSEDTGAEFMIEDIHPFSWVDTGDIWIYGSVYAEWRRMNFKIAEFNPETRSIRTAEGNEWGARYSPKHNSFYYFNILEELDTPGEWYLDKKSGLLYVYPTVDLTGKEILYDATHPTNSDSYFMHLTRVENVIINGITFKNTRGNGIYVANENSKHVIVQNCHFSNMRLGVYMAGRYSGVINSTFTDLYDRGIQLNLPSTNDTYTLVPARQFAMNNILHNTTGIYSGGIGNVISHNVVSNNRGSAIRPSANENIVEYNEIVAGPRETMDSGAIYVGGGSAFKRGIHVRYNYIHDIGNIKPNGIYMDDMLSECYTYGNIVDGTEIFLNATRECTVYNNIVLNYQNSAAINLGKGYYAVNGSVNIRWKPGSLEYGNMTKPLDPDSKYNFETYINRYPILGIWIPQMRERIAEYETTKDGYHSDIYQSETYPGYTDLSGRQYELNQYLSASRDNQFENNVIINSKEMSVGQGNTTEGYVRTVFENNHSYDNNPFTSENYGDLEAYSEILADNPDFEVIPFEKIGLTSGKTISNEKTVAVRPANDVVNTIPKEGLALQWKNIAGAQKYKVELSDTSDFAVISESATLVEDTYSITTALEDGKTYYWRVTTIPDSTYAVGGEMVSDTFAFKTQSGGNSNFNLTGVTDYTCQITDSGAKITAYGFNLTEDSATVDVYAACYDIEGKLIDIDFEKATVESNEFSEKIVLYLNTSEFDTLKLFVWAENSLYPVTFVRKITK